MQAENRNPKKKYKIRNLHLSELAQHPPNSAKLTLKPKFSGKIRTFREKKLRIVNPRTQIQQKKVAEAALALIRLSSWNS